MLKITLKLFILGTLIHSHQGAFANPEPIISSMPVEILFRVARMLDDKSVVSLSITCSTMATATLQSRLQRCKIKWAELKTHLVSELTIVHNGVWNTFGTLWPFMRGFGPLHLGATADFVHATSIDFLLLDGCSKNIRELYLERLNSLLQGRIKVCEMQQLNGFLHPEYRFGENEEAKLVLLTASRNSAWNRYKCAVAKMSPLLAVAGQNMETPSDDIRPLLLQNLAFP